MAMVLTTALLLVSSSGVIAMLIPYAAEIYPVHLRGTGSGVIAASSKFGGILGAGFGVLGVFGHFTLSALLIAVPMAVAALMLIRAASRRAGAGWRTSRTCSMPVGHAALARSKYAESKHRLEV